MLLSLTRDRLPQDRLQAIQFYRTVLQAAAQRSPEHLRQAKRWLARNDLFFLADDDLPPQGR
jgi:hypothetical protein